MFAKLLKSEFRAVRSGMAAVCASALIAGVAGGLALRYINETNRGTLYENWVLKLTCNVIEGGALIALVACGVAAVILLLSRFYRSRFTDEGYLTFTLPVNTHEVLLSSLASSLLCLILTAVVLVGSFALLCLIGISGDPDFWEWFWEIPKALSAALQRSDINVAAVLAELVFSAVATCLWQITCLMLAISVGALIAKKHKILAAVGIYYLIQMTVGIVQIFQLNNVLTAQVGDELMNVLLLQGILSLVLAVLSYFLTCLLVSWKLNLP